ncbi:MAG: hypothetical protein U0575_05300 [Phycisphaerales bacterium]
MNRSLALVASALAVAASTLPPAVLAAPQAAQSAERSASPSAPPVEACVSAWMVARGWLDQFGLPRESDAAAAVPLPSTSGVSVVLRAAGAVVGRADVNPADGLALRRAMGRAMGEALATMRSAIEKSGENAGPRLTLELELAGEPTPLLGKTVVDAARRVRPGVDGLAIRRGDRWALAYPGRLLAANTADNPVATFAALAADVGLQANDLADLKKVADVALYRVETVRLVQFQPGAPPVALIRNDELVADSAVTRAALTDLVAATARRLVRAVYRPSADAPPRGFLGDYRSVSDERRPPIAPAFEQALCCFALLHLTQNVSPGAATTSGTDANGSAGASRDPAASSRAEGDAFVAETRRTVLQVLEALSTETSTAVVGSGGDAFGDRRAAAAAALAILELPADGRPPWLAQMLEWALARVNEGFSERDGFIDTDGKPLSAQSQALLACALARAARASAATAAGGASLPTAGSAAGAPPAPAPATAASAASGTTSSVRDASAFRARAAIAADAAWRGVSPPMRVSLLPWIVWVERDLAATNPVGTAPRPRSALLDLRDQVLASQAGRGDVALDREDADLRGGFALAGAGASAVGGSDGSPNVTAQSLRPIAGLAAMLADPEMTPAPARVPLAARQRDACRFILQLAVRPPMNELYRRPETVVGGIREATWDSTQPVAAQAMALVALVDSLAVWSPE